MSCHQNHDNPNNKFKNKNLVVVNGVSTQFSGGIRHKFNNKCNRGKVNKSCSIIYRCFICNSIEHKIYNYAHKDAAQALFREKSHYAKIWIL